MDDLQLLEAVFAQDEIAWHEFLSRFRHLIYRCITKVLTKHVGANAAQEIDEVFSEVCLNLLRNDMKKLRAYDPDRKTKLSSWLGLIAINSAYDHLRSRARQPLLDQIEGCPDREDLTPSPLEMLLSAERRNRVYRLALEFSRRDQRFIELYFSRGMAPKDIATTLNISVKTVYSKKNKIRNRLLAIAQNEFVETVAAA
jgi:RNA polymerase sigma-70 factor (ECF subfamily)